LNAFTTKFREVAFAVLPITLIVLILNFTIAPLEIHFIIRFFIGALLITIGLTVFLLGVDIGITEIGKHLGSVIAKSNRILVVVIAGLILGFIISAAEPDLHVLAGQVESVTAGLVSKLSIIITVSLGIAFMLALGLVRIVFNIPLHKVLSISYLVILVLAVFTSSEFLAIAFDASGSTTGALTVPFIMALALGITVLKKDSKASEKDSFGLVAIASAGAIMGVLIMSIIAKTGTLTGELEYSDPVSTHILLPFIEKLPKVTYEVFLSLLPIIVIFIVFQIFSFKLHKRPLRKIIVGLVFTFFGLILFFIGVNAGFLDAGKIIGNKIASLENKSYFIITGFALGFVTVLAEPAVYVLTQQVEDITSGYIKRKTIMAALSLGVGVAVALSMVRILVPGIKLWHYLLPCYLIALSLNFFTPKLFTGISFDAGGVASGPMTATFIMAYSQGAANAIAGANVLADGFGMIAMVAVMPIITLQLLGLIYKIKSRKGGLKKDEKLRQP